jgi:hypothetical protein
MVYARLMELDELEEGSSIEDSTSSAGEGLEEGVEEAVEQAEEPIDTEQEHQQTQPQETTWQELEQLRKGSKDKEEGSEGKDKPSSEVSRVRRLEAFWASRRDGKDGKGSGDGKDSKGSGDGHDGHDGHDGQDEEEGDYDSDGESMEIFVVKPEGKTIALDVTDSYTIGTVKALIKNIEGIPRCQQRLIFAATDLEDDVTLAGYKIKNASTLQLAMRLEGSGKRGRGEASGAVSVFFGQPVPLTTDSHAVKQALSLRTISIQPWLASLAQPDLDNLIVAVTRLGAGGNTEAQVRAYSTFIGETKKLADPKKPFHGM